jgi:hypothetical protein
MRVLLAAHGRTRTIDRGGATLVSSSPPQRGAVNGCRPRSRLNRGGNRRLNAILYRIALTQAHYSKDARAYLDRRVGEGKSRREAIRALKRFIIRAIWRLWQRCESPSASHSLAAVA